MPVAGMERSGRTIPELDPCSCGSSVLYQNMQAVDRNGVDWRFEPLLEMVASIADVRRLENMHVTDDHRNADGAQGTAFL